MLCDKCKKNNAVTHIKTVINGIVYEKHLCEKCAAEEGMNDNFVNPFSQLFGSFFEDLPQINTDTIKCPICGSTFSNILDTGKLGCSECYATFENQIAPYIKKLQGSGEYLGKSIDNKQYDTVKDTNQNDISELQVLQDELQKAVNEERFEDAAVLRDKINKLKEEK